MYHKLIKPSRQTVCICKQGVYQYIILPGTNRSVSLGVCSTLHLYLLFLIVTTTHTLHYSKMLKLLAYLSTRETQKVYWQYSEQTHQRQAGSENTWCGGWDDGSSVKDIPNHQLGIPDMGNVLWNTFSWQKGIWWPRLWRWRFVKLSIDSSCYQQLTAAVAAFVYRNSVKKYIYTYIYIYIYIYIYCSAPIAVYALWECRFVTLKSKPLQLRLPKLLWTITAFPPIFLLDRKKPLSYIFVCFGV